MRSGLCNCLAIYDWDGDISPVRFHEIVKAMFDANGVLPDTGSITMLGAQNNSVLAYSRVVANLPKLQGGVDFFHTIPGYKQLVFGWDVSASLDTGKYKTMVLCFAQNLAGIGLDYFEGVIRTLAKDVDLKYGIGYQRDFELGPDLYASGLITGLGYSPKDMKEADRIGVWMYERPDLNRHLQGYLRDVYPLNILSSRHLSREVGGLSLSQWIEQNPTRGSLERLSNDAWTWKVDNSNLADVQSELHQAGCLIVPPSLFKP